MKKVSMVFDGLERLLKKICALLLVAFTVLTLAQIVMRYVFSAPLSWSEQAARYLFVWMLMLYMPVVMRDRGNMSFDLLTQKLSARIRDYLWLICEILIGIFGACYCYYSIQLCEKFSHKTMVGLGIPAVWVYSSQIVGAGLLCLFTLEIVIYHIKDIRNGKLEGGKTC